MTTPKALRAKSAHQPVDSEPYVSPSADFVPPVLPPSDGRPMLGLSQIVPFPRIHFEVDVFWTLLELTIHLDTKSGLDLNPVFQRAHVWTEAQQIAYVEHVLRGGEVGKSITFVCRNWMRYPTQGFAILDGKQRVEAVRRFMRGALRVFGDAARPEGYALQDFDPDDRALRMYCAFKWRVVEARRPVDVLDLYLAINAGGTPHAPEELDRVRALREAAACLPDTATLADLPAGSL